MKICVVGADCFIGVPLVRRFLKSGNEVIAVVRPNSQNTCALGFEQNISIVPLDFLCYDELCERTGYFDCMVVLTWIGTRGLDRVNESLQKKNYQIIYKTIKSAIKNGCKKVLTAGSQAEYGLCDQIITEETPCKPNTAYGKYKYKLFTNLETYCKKNGVSFKEPRFFSLYGPGDYQGSLIMSTISKMINGLECSFTDSTQMWDYLYVEDAVEAVSLLCTKECADGAYNLGSGDIRQLKEYIEELKKVLGSNSPLKYGVIQFGPTGKISIQPSIAKLKNELNWAPKYTFANGIKSTLKSLNNNGI